MAYVLGLIRATVEREQKTARTDFVTGVPNSRSFWETLERTSALSRRTGQSLSVASLDLDGFKGVNDAHGHSKGDDVLRAVASAMRLEIRASDVCARVGGDEFAVLFPATETDEALVVLERVRSAIRRLADAENLHVSVSVGVATREGAGCSADELMRRADELMYEVNATGKDGVRS